MPAREFTNVDSTQLLLGDRVPRLLLGEQCAARCVGGWTVSWRAVVSFFPFRYSFIISGLENGFHMRLASICYFYNNVRDHVMFACAVYQY